MKMKNAITFLVLALLPICGYSQGYGKGYPFVVQQERQASWSGSGIAIGKRHIATNHHVVDGATHMSVSLSGEDEEYRAETVVYDVENDLAIVEITDEDFPGFGQIRYGFKTEPEDVGMGVFVLGYPLVSTMGSEIKLTTGVVSSRSGYEGNISQYQISAPVQPGNSGGPLFNDNGELIGIVSAKHTEAENVGYSVKLSYLSALADGVEGVDMNNTTRIAELSLSEKCKSVIPFTVMVQADNYREQSQRKNDKSHGTPFDDAPSAGNSGQKGTYPVHFNSPSVADSNDPITAILGVELTESYTGVYLTLANNQHDVAYYQVNEGIYLEDTRTGKKYKLVSTENCAIAPSKSILSYGRTAHFAFYFEPLPADATNVNMIEPGDGSWKFYGIALR